MIADFTTPSVNGKDRGVYSFKVPPVGWAILFACDRHGREVARIMVPAAQQNAAIDFLRDSLEDIDPDVPLRERLTVSKGGNQPARGRPRKPARLTLLPGGAAQARR